MPTSDLRLSPLPSQNPLPLTSAQETQVRDLYYKRVRSRCADEIRDFASCALNRTFTATWVCRVENRAMNSCMVAYATQAEQDAAREEWFATIDDRRRQKAEKEEKKREQERFHREWWGLPKLDDQGKEGEGQEKG